MRTKSLDVEREEFLIFDKVIDFEAVRYGGRHGE